MQLPDLCAHPAVTAYLDAADRATNSNSLLLPLPADAQPTAQYISEWLHSTHFASVWLAADRQRGWYNYHTTEDHLAGDWPKDTELVPATLTIQLTQLPLVALQTLLLQLLTVPKGSPFFSPYGTALPMFEAQNLQAAFVQAMQPTAAHALAPNFFYTLPEQETGLVTDHYFGGTPNDTATYIVCPQGQFLLLTNGIP